MSTEYTYGLSQEADERIFEALRAAGFKILKKFESQNEFHPDTASPKNCLMVIDTETTGKDTRSDIAIEIGYVLVEYDPKTSTIHKVVDRYNGLEDPGVPLDPKITKITGITDEDLAGQRFDEERIRSDIARTNFVIAHNAKFDRPMLERRFPEFANMHWGCSIADAPWDETEIGGKKLDWIAFQLLGTWYEAHRAVVDSEVCLSVLNASILQDQRSVFSHILESARQPRYRVWAVKSPFECKDILKENEYRWNGDNLPGGVDKTWYKDDVTDLDAELEFLSGLYGTAANIVVDLVGAKNRYAHMRYDERNELRLSAPKPVAQSSAATPTAEALSPAIVQKSGVDSAFDGIFSHLSKPTVSPNSPISPVAPPETQPSTTPVRRRGFR